MAIFDIDSVESKIGYTFKDKMLLRKCFVHASYGNEHCEENNELLEFFGDSILGFIVTEYLYANANGDEGALTKKRADMVSKAPLLNAVVGLGLDEYVLLGRGLANDKILVEQLKNDLSWIAPVYVYPGSHETMALAAGAIRVLKGEEEAKKYLGRPVWEGFDFE